MPLFATVTLSNAQTEDAQWDNPPRKLTEVILPGAGHINVEKLRNSVNLNMDVNKLSLPECRVLRNAFAARQGYAFMSGDLRAIFETTSWYDSLMYDRFEKEQEALSKFYNTKPNGYQMSEQEEKNFLQQKVPMRYTKAELAFINKIDYRMKQLMKQNFAVSSGKIVNTSNIINPWQLEKFDQRLINALGTNGFAIVPNNYEQLFHVYERNDYHDFPSFVTTDLYLQLFHMYFDCLLREVEEKNLYGFIEHFCKQMEKEMGSLSLTGDNNIKDAADYNATYFAIARALLAANSADKAVNALGNGVPAAYRQMATDEINKVFKVESNYSDFLDYRESMFPYGLFRPRGHYTRNDTLSCYFRAMMWLQTVPFGTNKEQQLRCAAVMAHVIGSHPALKAAYLKVSDPITYLMGTPDNITILQVYDEMQKTGMPLEKLLKNKKKMAELRKNIEFIGEQQTRIRPKFEYSSHCKINLMPQRYMPDAEVLQEMVDYVSDPTKRDAPKGLDFFAAMGNTAAERILINELNEDKRWEGYKPTMQKMKQRMGEIQWQDNIATQWMETLGTMIGTGKGKQNGDEMPYFMQTAQWAKKDLNAALASWAELKHDAILYAKQPMGAECGDWGPPAPVVKAYVEPNIVFWTKAIQLTDATLSVLKKYQLTTPMAEDITNQMKEEATFLLNISRKELAKQKLTDDEYYHLEVIGATFENMTLNLIRKPDQWLQGWSDVQGADKSVAVVADVYTANADNNPVEKRSILYEGVGPASDIYVVVEIDGFLYLTRGAVFSYREFKRALNEPRMTDEEWQKELKQRPKTGIPSWMNEIIVPLEDEVKDNEYIFYSTGC